MIKVLLSIKPEFAFKIFEGTKEYEFRKVIFKRPNIKTVLVYASFPEQKVIGEFEIESILKDRPEVIWKKTKDRAGVSEEYFYKYFSNRNTAYAIKIKKIMAYKEPLNLREKFNLSPPQSFMYL